MFLVNQLPVEYSRGRCLGECSRQVVDRCGLVGPVGKCIGDQH